METAIRNAAEGRDIDLIVVTDAEAILGIGDWGTNGVSISVGKLMVYTAAAGLDPARVCPLSSMPEPIGKASFKIHST